MLAEEFHERGQIILPQLFELFGVLRAVQFRVFRLGKAGSDAPAVRALVGQQKFRHAENIFGGNPFVHVRRGKVERIFRFHPRAQLGRKLQPVNEFVARGDGILFFRFLHDFRVALRENIERELPHRLVEKTLHRDDPHRL